MHARMGGEYLLHQRSARTRHTDDKNQFFVLRRGFDMRLIRVEIVKINWPENMFQRAKAQIRVLFVIRAILLKKGVALFKISDGLFNVAAVTSRLS